MKKYLSVILGIILTACLVACGSSNKDSVNDDKQYFQTWFATMDLRT